MALHHKAKLTPEAQTFVVTSLACWDPPSVVAENVKKDYGIAISPQALECYDPTKHAGRNISDKWKSLFEATRKAFTDNTADIGISHKSVRLRTLQRMASKAESMGNLALAAQLNEQAAKEMGNAYTNTRVLQGGLAITTPKTLDDFYGGSADS